MMVSTMAMIYVMTSVKLRSPSLIGSLGVCTDFSAVFSAGDSILGPGRFRISSSLGPGCSSITSFLRKGRSTFSSFLETVSSIIS